MNSNFSIRNAVGPPAPLKLTRDVAPEAFRSVVINFLKRDRGLSNTYIRDLVAAGIGKIPDFEHNWGEPNVWQEAAGMMRDAEWFQVYEAAESIHGELSRHHSGYEEPYQQQINDVLRTQGVAWEMVDGVFISIGDEVEASILSEGLAALSNSNLSVAKEEMLEAIRCLSRRPDPNLSGALHHATTALESVAREATGDKKATFGQILSKHQDLLPKPLDDAAGMLWGYASNHARHGREDRDLDLGKVRLIVGVCATLITFLTGKLA
jgi:hypothetical protein